MNQIIKQSTQLKTFSGKSKIRVSNLFYVHLQNNFDFGIYYSYSSIKDPSDNILSDENEILSDGENILKIF